MPQASLCNEASQIRRANAFVSAKNAVHRPDAPVSECSERHYRRGHLLQTSRALEKQDTPPVQQLTAQARACYPQRAVM